MKCPFKLKKIIRMLLWLILFLLLVAALGGYYVWLRMGDAPSAEERTSFEKIASYRDGRFHGARPFAFYPDRVQGGTPGWLKFLSASPNAPRHILPVIKQGRGSFSGKPGEYSLCWLGHSSAIFDLGGVRLCIDPVLGNAAPVPRMVSRYAPSPIMASELPELDYVLISHDHYDHLEYDTIRSLIERKTEFIVPSGVGARLRGWGIPADRIHELAWGESFRTERGVTITAEEGTHFSGRSLWDRNKTLWCAFILEGGGRRIFWSGDTGYGDHFARIGEKYGEFDLACMEIDAGNPGWPTVHLLPEEVIRATKDVRARALLPVHWGVFDLGMHVWDESISAVSELSRKENIPLVTPKMGEIIQPGTTLTEPWWLDVGK